MPDWLSQTTPEKPGVACVNRPKTRDLTLLGNVNQNFLTGDVGDLRPNNPPRWR